MRSRACSGVRSPPRAHVGRGLVLLRPSLFTQLGYEAGLPDAPRQFAVLVGGARAPVQGGHRGRSGRGLGHAPAVAARGRGRVRRPGRERRWGGAGCRARGELPAPGPSSSLATVVVRSRRPPGRPVSPPEVRSAAARSAAAPPRSSARTGLRSWTLMRCRAESLLTTNRPSRSLSKRSSVSDCSMRRIGLVQQFLAHAEPTVLDLQGVTVAHGFPADPHLGVRW